MKSPAYGPARQAEIDQEAANIRNWLAELSPGTLEWIREDDALRSTLRAILADCLAVPDPALRAEGWIGMMQSLR